MDMKRGTFYAVGVGPGDPELITAKAVRILSACPVVAAPITKSGQMLALEIAAQAADLSGKRILPLRFTMERKEAVRRSAHQQAAEQIAAELDQGRDVAMLNLGDVSIYATASYMVELLGQRGYETVMVPGVPSFCAVAAELGISLTDMDAPLHIVPAGGGPLEETLELPGTKVLMKSGKRIAQVVKVLQDRALPAAMVQDCGLPGQRVYEDLETIPEDVGYFATFVVKEGKR